MNRLLVFAFLFFIGSLTGWILELFFRRFFSKNNPDKKWINPGFLVGPWLPIYGFGLWGMYFVSRKIAVHIELNQAADIAVVFVLMAVTMTVIEYLAGLIFIKGLKVKLWDYSGENLNIQGIICPKFTFFWGLLGCFYYLVINPYVIGWVEWLSYHLTFSFFIGTAFGIFIIDFSYSMQIVASMKRFAEEKEIIIKYEEFKDHIRMQREKLEERKRFIMAFKSEAPFRDLLESYLEDMIEDNADRINQVRENIIHKIS
ncbi:MAG: hypothetical protein Q4C14_04225 [Bacillota bacterium]|nr:hypothetical protein [Bacillota bacterium]